MMRNVWNRNDYSLCFDLSRDIMSFVQVNYAIWHVGSRASIRSQENAGLMMMHHDGT